MRFVLLAVLLSGCIIPFATPPLKGELGGGTRVGREGERNSKTLHAAVGTHLASGTTSTTQRFDVGAGWTMDKTADTLAHGLYVDAAVFVDRTRRARTSVGGRGELRWMDEGRAAAAKLRIDAELFGSGSREFESDGHCGSTSGVHHGTTAIGVFVEAGHVWAPGDPMTTRGGNAWVATAGLTLRLPSAAGVWVGVPGC